MAQELSKIDLIPVPDARRPIPSLPVWLTSRTSALAENLQIDQRTGKFEDLMTLPTTMLLEDAQRRAIQEHLANLRLLLEMTPIASEAHEKHTFALITKLMLAKPARAAGAEAAEARGEAYTMALDDVPCWAVEGAIRRWYRGEAGTDERGKPFEYQWAPDSAVLRKLALSEVGAVHWRIRDLERLLAAVPFQDCSAQLARGRAAWRGLRSMANTAGGLEEMTFAKAVELGEKLPDDLPQKQAAE